MNIVLAGLLFIVLLLVLWSPALAVAIKLNTRGDFFALRWLAVLWPIEMIAVVVLCWIATMFDLEEKLLYTACACVAVGAMGALLLWQCRSPDAPGNTLTHHHHPSHGAS